MISQRAEYSTTFANPDGATFTLEQSAVPVRVALPDGSWAAPDATLVRRSDGTVGPRAAVAGISFSGGGDGSSLVTIAEAGKSLELGWPGRLPSPQLAGDRAVYQNVLPDVNLVLTATVEGFRQVLEVRTPQAAADPALKRIEFSLKSEGLTVQHAPGGGFAAVDADGATVFRAPTARMWNSAGDAPADGTSASVAPTSAAASTSPSPSAMVSAQSAPLAARALSADADAAMAPPDGDSSVAGPGEPDSDPVTGPGDGDESAVLKVDVSSQSIAVVPDQALIAATSADEYPLIIDPSVTWGESERTVLSSDGDVFYNFSDGTSGMGVGKCGSAVIGGVSYYCGSGYVNRMYFEFAPDALKGKQVLDATFRITETWSFTCDARWVDLARTDEISSSTKWPGPTYRDLMGDRYVSHGRGDLCDPSQPRATVEFNDNPAETDENLTPTVKSFAAGNLARLTLMLRAHDETDTTAWKRFNGDAVLDVTYVGIPALPQAVGFVTGGGTSCSTNSADPGVLSDPTPQVTGKPATVSGGESGARLRIRWRVDKWDGSAWVTATSDVTSPTSGFVGNLVPQSPSWSTTLSEGVSYRLKALTMSFEDDGSTYINTGYTAPCYFKVDPTAPKAPVIKFGSPYSECTANACAAAGGPGVAGSFTFSPGSGDTSNVSYRYKLSTDSAWSAEKSGSTVTVSVAPVRSGTVVLYAQAKDSVGRWGAESSVQFLVAEGSGPVGQWHFDEASGVFYDTSTTVAANQDNAGYSATGLTRSNQGRRGLMRHAESDGSDLATPVEDKGLRLDGSSGWAGTAGPVIDTRASFTLSAWARLDGTTGYNETLLGQDGAHRSPFYLSYEPSIGKWSIRITDTDAPADGSWNYTKVVSAQPAEVGVWTHLGVVYNASAHALSLYINGLLSQTVSCSTTWTGTGGIQFGRVKWSDQYVDLFKGDIDEVRIWQRALTSDEIKTQARLLDGAGQAYSELVGNWQPDGQSGTTLADSTAYSHGLSLSGGASLDGTSLTVDGASGAATINGPLVDDLGSFTATAQLQVDQDVFKSMPIGATAQVLGQRTSNGSSWSLWLERTADDVTIDDSSGEPIEVTVPTGKWHFGRIGQSGTTDTSVVSDERALLNAPVRLTGVFNAQEGTISLYLGATRNDAPTAFTATVGSGEFAVGKGYTDSVWGHYLPAKFTDIRLWAGAMDNSDQLSAVLGD